MRDFKTEIPHPYLVYSILDTMDRLGETLPKRTWQMCSHAESRIFRPLFFRANDALLASLGFDPEQMSAIYGFLDYVKRIQGVEFEQCLTEGVNRNCLPVAGSA